MVTILQFKQSSKKGETKRKKKQTSPRKFIIHNIVIHTSRLMDR